MSCQISNATCAACLFVLTNRDERAHFFTKLTDDVFPFYFCLFVYLKFLRNREKKCQKKITFNFFASLALPQPKTQGTLGRVDPRIEIVVSFIPSITCFSSR